MLSPLRHRVYARLFCAQVSALLGTGLATVALGLLAHEIAGASAGEILGYAGDQDDCLCRRGASARRP